MSTNNLAKVFDWLGEVFERANPATFRFLAAVLPYLTPLPVAWLTASSASVFLSFTPFVAGIFVFCLEGIGLWFTTLFVDSVVDWVRSRNKGTFVIVVLFAFAVTAYVVILVDLNVTLEKSVGSVNPALSRVITLLCFLPLLTGIGNGYYKLKLDYKTDTEQAKRKNEELEERIRQERREDGMKKYKIKRGINPDVVYQQTSASVKDERQKKASAYKEKMWVLLDEKYSNGKVLGVKEITDHFHLPYDKAKGFVSTQRTLWAQSRGAKLQ